MFLPTAHRPNSESKITRGAVSRMVFRSFALGSCVLKYASYAFVYAPTSRPIIGMRLVRITWSGVTGPLVAISSTSSRLEKSMPCLLLVRLNNIGLSITAEISDLNRAISLRIDLELTLLDGFLTSQAFCLIKYCSARSTNSIILS